MSLLDHAFETFAFIDKRRQPDGEGGYIVEWLEGAEIQANARYDSSMQARRAEIEGVTSLYTITTRPDLVKISRSKNLLTREDERVLRDIKESTES